MNVEPVQAAITIQRRLRAHWQEAGRVFPSKRLEKAASCVAKTLETIGMATLCHFNREAIPMGRQRRVLIYREKKDSLSLLEDCIGLARLPFCREEADFADELAVHELLSLMGLTGVVYQGVRRDCSVDFSKFFAMFGKNTTCEKGSLLDHLFQCSTFKEAVAYVKTLSDEEKRQCKLDEKMRLVNPVLGGVENVVQAIFKAAEKDLSHPNLRIPLYLFTGPETGRHGDADLERIPEKRRQQIASFLGAEKLPASFLGGEVLQRFISQLDKHRRKEFCSLVTTYSFEQLMAVSYLLGIPDFSYDQLSCYLTPYGKIHLYVKDSDLKVFSTSNPDENWLTTLPHMDGQVSENFRLQVQGWVENVFEKLAGTALDNEQLVLVKHRILQLAKVLKREDRLTWRALMNQLRPDWVDNAIVIETLREELLIASSTVKYAADHPTEGYVDLLCFRPKSRSVNWKKFYQRVKEITQVVNEVMPRVIAFVDQYSRQDPEPHVHPFLCDEDRKDPKKFIGVMCCRITTNALRIFLKAHGIHAVNSGSIRIDHAFLRIPTEFGVDVFVDPTYKQLFTHPKAMLNRYWHQIPPALVGGPREFRDFYLKHKRLPKPFSGHDWIYPENFMHEDESWVNWTHHVLNGQTNGISFVFEKYLKDFLTQKELNTLQQLEPGLISKSYTTEVGLQLPVERVMRLLPTFVARILYHSLPAGQRPFFERPLEDAIPGQFDRETLMTLYAVLLRRLGYDTHKVFVGLNCLKVTSQRQPAVFVIPTAPLFLKEFAKRYGLTIEVDVSESFRDNFVGTFEELKVWIQGELGFQLTQNFNRFKQGPAWDKEILAFERGLESPLGFKELSKKFKLLVQGIVGEALLRTSASDRP